MSTPGAYDGPTRVGTIRPSQAIHSYGVGALDRPAEPERAWSAGSTAGTSPAKRSSPRTACSPPSEPALGPQVEQLLAPARRAADDQQPVRRLGPRRRPGDRVPALAALHRLQPAVPGRVRRAEARPQPVPDRPDPLHPPELRQGPQAAAGRARPGSSPAAPNGHLDDFPWVRFAHDGVADVREPDPAGQRRRLRRPRHRPAGRVPHLRRQVDAGQGLRPGRQDDDAAVPGPPPPPRRSQRAVQRAAPHAGARRVQPVVQQQRLGAVAPGRRRLARPARLRPLGDVREDAGQGSAGLRARRRTGRSQAAFAGYDARRDLGRRSKPAGPAAAAAPAPTCAGPSGRRSTTGSQRPDVAALRGRADRRARRRSPASSPASRSPTGCASSPRCAASPGSAPASPTTCAASPRSRPSGAPTWVPVVENRGEGIFLRLDEDAVQAWEANAFDNPLFEAMRRAHREWRSARGLDPTQGWPGERYVLLHSLSHALINELAIECGYSSASISERIYSRAPGEGPEPMAGILLYTSAPDAEGTLGGLVNLGQPSELGPILRRALERAGLCSSDPLCADHEPDAANSSHPRRRLPRLPARRRDQLRARQPLPRPLDARRHLPPHRPRVLRVSGTRRRRRRRRRRARRRARPQPRRRLPHRPARTPPRRPQPCGRPCPPATATTSIRSTARGPRRPTRTGASIALALETALAAKRARRRPPPSTSSSPAPTRRQRPSGSPPRSSASSSTSAQQRVTLVSYAAYQMPAVIAALDAAVARGVRVDLILESPENLEGGGGAQRLREVPRPTSGPSTSASRPTPSSTPRPSSSTAATSCSPAPT